MAVGLACDGCGGGSRGYGGQEPCVPCVLTLCAPSLVQLRAAQGDTNFEKEWNQKFGWFTQSKECQQITTIHGEKSSMTVKPDCPALLYVLPLFSLLPRSPPTLSSHALLSVFCSLSLSSLFLARIFLCLLSRALLFPRTEHARTKMCASSRCIRRY